MKDSCEKLIYENYKQCLNKLNEKFMLPCEQIGEGKNIILYGAGNVGRSYYRQLIQRRYSVTAWVDSNFQKYEDNRVPILSPKQIKEYDFDKVVIAIENKKIKDEVLEFLICEGISVEKIV